LDIKATANNLISPKLQNCVKNSWSPSEQKLWLIKNYGILFHNVNNNLKITWKLNGEALIACKWKMMSKDLKNSF
jgi:hypothetical protein